MRRLSSLLLVLTVVAALGCERTPVADSAAGGSPSAPGVVDSTLPIDTLLHRFRATLPDSPAVLTGGAATRSELVAALFKALQANNDAGVRALAITPSEFAWLYYPHTKWTKPPYEMGPELVWLQVRANSDKGRMRLLRDFGGKRLTLESLHCPGAPLHEGPNTLVEGCRVRFAVGDSASRELQLFGSLLSRDGRYKFVSYSNDL